MSKKYSFLIQAKHVFDGKEKSTYEGFLCLKDKQIVKMGKGKASQKILEEAEEILEFDKELVMSGITDTHTFFTGYAVFHLGVDVSEIKTNEEGEKALKAYEEEKHPKNVLFGHGWKPTQWKQKDGEQMLEEVFPDKPVILFAEDRGSCIMNEKAKEVYQFTSDSCYPESYYRIMKEYLNDREFIEKELKDYAAMLNSRGVTSVKEMGFDDFYGFTDYLKEIENSDDLHPYTLIFLLIVLVAVLTWIIPSGEFQRTMVETSTGEREVVVAGTYQGVSKIAEDGTNLRQGIQAVLTAPALGIQNAIEVLAFVFIIGGVFQIMAKTNALNMGIRSIIDKLGDKEFLMIPILMILFGLGGTTYGMSDELVPFYLLVMPVVFAMGYDSMTTFMIVCMSATVGYAASTINPFCVLVAQGIAGIQGNPQLVFRMIQWVIMMAIIIAFTTIRAMKVKKNPQSSITYKDDIIKRQEMITQEAGNTKLTVRQKLVLVVFVAGMALIITGLVKFGWYMNELSMVFLGMGLLMGIIGGLGETEIAEEFVAGVKDIAFAAILIGFCSGIMVVANDGKIIDTILNSLSNLLAGTGNVLFVVVMYIVQSVLTLLVPSSSGLAALTMPIMSSLCDLHGANPEAAVTVLQYANQLTNMMSPVAGTTVAGLAVCRISFSQWWKTIWKVFVVLTIIALVFCAISAGM